MRDFTYKELIAFLVNRLTKPEKMQILRQWRPKLTITYLSRIKLADFNKFFLTVATEPRCEALYKKYSDRFGLTARDVKEFLGLSLHSNQLIRLSRVGKIKVVGHHHAKTGVDLELYDPFDFRNLEPDDFKVSDENLEITKNTLLQNGWTKKLIRDFLPPPREVPNPMCKSAAPMQLWDSDEVERIRHTPECETAWEKTKRAKQGAAKAIQKKRDKLMSQLDEKIREISVDGSYSSKRLREMAIMDRQCWYDAVAAERDDGDVGHAAGAPEDTINRWVVNFVRHRLTNYDRDLYDFAGKVGHSEAYIKYREAVLDAIAEAYPSYSAECQRQKDEAWLIHKYARCFG